MQERRLDPIASHQAATNESGRHKYDGQFEQHALKLANSRNKDQLADSAEHEAECENQRKVGATSAE